MKRGFLTLISFISILSFQGYSSTPTDNLEHSIKKYNTCLLNNNFKCMLNMIDPIFYKTMNVSVGGMLKEYENSDMKILAISSLKRSMIVSDGDYLAVVISYDMTSQVSGQKVDTSGKSVAISKDGGQNWYFLDYLFVESILSEISPKLANKLLSLINNGTGTIQNTKTMPIERPLY